MTDAGAQPYTTVGNEFTTISVSISYRIIELFSAGLYKSPNKAIEELVSNSWDAEAQNVWLFFSPNLAAADAAVWVVDDGTSMDLQGLVELWQIADSPKVATRDDPNAARPQIGKFGIGKLATYILARTLTYICKKGDQVLAVTMDYDRVDTTSKPGNVVKLGVRELESSDVEAALNPLRALQGGNGVVDELLDTLDDPDASWTVATLSSLKPMAQNVKTGMVRWLLATALPRSPGFAIQVDGTKVKPASEKVKPLKAWIIGTDPGVEPKKLPEGVTAVKGKKAADSYVEVDGLPDRVTGCVEVYEDVLTKNKASDWGRSHGFFVQVRGRLVNIDDALFGMPALSHATFNRFRMVVNADGLDKFLASTRESVQEDERVTRFQAYLRAEFNRARNFYEAWVEQQEAEAHLPTRIDRTAASLSRQPLVAAVRDLIQGEISDLSLIKRPATAADDPEGFLQSLEQTLEEGEKGPIDDVVLAALGTDHYLAVYDPDDRLVRVNTLHPFYANFIDTLGRTLPFKLLAVTEVLTEAYAVEESGAEAARNIVARRDAFLRELVHQHREGPAVIAENLRNMASDPDGLEEATADAMRSLGYEVTRIGGNGKPDGLAKAVIGAQSADSFSRDDYAVTYDTKSTGSKAVKAHTVGISTLVRHRNDYGAQHILVVAPGFEGASDANSALCKECAEHGVTPVTVLDLASLVEIQAGKMLGYTKLRELYQCRTVKESHDWIESLRDVDDEAPPLVEVLESIDHLRTLDRPPRVSTIALVLEDRHGIKRTDKEVEELLAILRGLAPRYITVVGDRVILETSPDKVRHAIARHYREIPPGLTDPAFEKSIDPDSPPPPKPAVARRRPPTSS
jgi:hypothetical protein